MAKPHRPILATKHALPQLAGTSVLSLLGMFGMLSMTGCMSPQNDRSYVGTDPHLVAPLDDLPYESAHQLDRTQWTPTTLNIPVDTTAHRPTYNSNVRYTRITTRQRNEFPTAEQALELTGDSRNTKIAEVPVVLGSAIIDAAAMPVRLVTSHQAKTFASPNVAYERTLPSYRPTDAVDFTTIALESIAAVTGSPATMSALAASSQSVSVNKDQARIGTMTPMHTAKPPHSEEAPR